MAISLFGVATNPSDNGSNLSDPTAITPPGSMVSGQLVVVFAVSRATSGTLSVSNAGGQTWTSLTQANQTTCRRRIFWCVFNGTWSANPSFTIGTTCSSAQMLVFSPTSSAHTWAADNALSSAVQAAPSTPFTCTITGVTRTSYGVAIGWWNTISAVTWGTLSGTGWSKTGLSAQYRNTAGSDHSSTFAYNIGTGATNNVSQNESAGSAGGKDILSFKETVALTVANATQAQTVDNVALTQHQILTVANATQAQTADNVSLTAHVPTYTLTVENATQAQTADNVVLTAHLPTYSLVVDDATQAQTADNVILTAHVPNYTLLVDDATQAQTTDEIILTAHNDIPPVTLFVDDCTQETRSDNIDLTYHPEGEVIVSDEGGWTDYTPMILNAYNDLDDEEAFIMYAALEAIA
jgi:hypothetical protein